ncbi:MAG: flagellar motor protein MotB [Rickettsiales bacterium]
MAADDRPIIVKKIKKIEGGHHGGAWKVAYADFVTAMMAFFLLMWLLSVTSSEQKQGLAEYFTPTIGIRDSMGVGLKGGLKSSEEGSSRNDLVKVGLVAGQVKQGDIAGVPNNVDGKSSPEAEDAVKKEESKENEKDKESDRQIQEVMEEIRSELEQDEFKDIKNSILMQETPEGLKINMIDDAKNPMFVPGSATLTGMGKKILDGMARMVAKTPNNISIKGHTDTPSSETNPQYTVWELSADRANAARRMLITTQLEPERVVKVEALADKELLVPQEPSNPRNRRITILILKDSYFKDPKAMPTTRSLLSVPDAKIIKKEPKKDKKSKKENKQKENEKAKSTDSIFSLPENN